jgi:glycosyltransferase involved in cell wall biosynthesis
MRRVLIITHHTSNTGAPNICLFVAKDLRDTFPNIEIDILALESNNSLDSEFKKMADNFIELSNFSKQPDYSILNRIKAKLYNYSIVSEYSKEVTRLANQNYDFIFANTVVSIPFSLKLKEINPRLKVVCYVLEMCTVIDQLCKNFKELICDIDLIAIISEFNKQHLISNYHLNLENSVNLIPPIVLKTSPNKNLKNLEEFNVVMIGSVHWRKGEDVFIQVANHVLKSEGNIHFYWIGYIDDYQKKIINSDLIRLGIDKNVHFVGELENPHELTSKMDVFILTSREEPFGMAAAEAGLLGLPILFFDNVTGVGEILKENGIQSSSPYLDYIHMSDRIIELYKDKDLCYNIGQKTKKIIQELAETSFNDGMKEIYKRISK